MKVKSQEIRGFDEQALIHNRCFSRRRSGFGIRRSFDPMGRHNFLGWLAAAGGSLRADTSAKSVAGLGSWLLGMGW
jgi:hypothetical protein